MNSRMIKSVLKMKFDNWVNSIEDNEVKKLVRQNTIITGGAITSLLLNEKPHDYDIYFRNFETTKAVAEYYVDLFRKYHDTSLKVKIIKKEDIPDYLNIEIDRIKFWIQSDGVTEAEEEEFEDYNKEEENNDILDIPDNAYVTEEDIHDVVSTLEKEIKEEMKDSLTEDEKENEYRRIKYRPLFFSSNAVTLSNKIQIIVRFYGEPEEIHKNYDYIHATCYWTSWNEELVLPQKALESIITKQLYYQGSKYPIASIVRSRKFIKRGWNISAGEYFKMIWQIKDLDLRNSKVLEEQLTGVDVAYFQSLINELNNIIKNKKDKISYSYIVKLVDKMFR